MRRRELPIRVVGALACLLAVASPAAGQGFIRGDAFADGGIDVSDVTYLVNFLYDDGIPPVPLDRADLNDNEIVNVTDFLKIMAFLFLGGAPPPAPIGSPGADPDDDLGTYGPVQAGFETRVVVLSVTPAAMTMAIEIESPVPVTNVELILGLASGFDGAEASFEFTPGTASYPGHDLRWTPPFLHLAAWNNPGTLSLPADGRLGILTISHAVFPVACPAPGDIAWVPEATVEGILCRASIASDLFVDHHPSGTVDPCGSAVVVIPWFRRGDCDGNAILDISDGVRAIDGLFRGAPIPCASACDGNDDGVYDCADPVWILHYLFAGGPSPPAPFPECGGDPTPDALPCAGNASCP